MQSKEKFDKTTESRYSQKNYKREMKSYIEARNERKQLKDQEVQKRKKCQKMIHKFKLKKKDVQEFDIKNVLELYFDLKREKHEVPKLLILRISQIPKDHLESLVKDEEALKIIHSDVKPKRKVFKAAKVKAKPKINNKWENASSESEEVNEFEQLQSRVECLNGQDQELLSLYLNLVKDYEKALSKINSK